MLNGVITHCLPSGKNNAGGLRRKYQHGSYAQKFVRSQGELITSLTRGGDLAPPSPVEPLHFAGQLFFLLRRQLIRRWREPVSLAIQIGQAPLLGWMVGFAFKEDRFNSPLFLSSFISIWFGTNATARELVSERSLFLRESAAASLPRPRSSPSWPVTAWCSRCSCFLLLLSIRLVISFDLNFLQGVLILWLYGLCGASLGALISVLAKTEIAATAATPLVLIPLILFGGHLAPYDDDMPPSIRFLCNGMPSRWGYQALVESEMPNPQSPVFKTKDPFKPFQEFSRPQAQKGHPDDLDRPRGVHLGETVIALEGLGLTLATLVVASSPVTSIEARRDREWLLSAIKQDPVSK